MEKFKPPIVIVAYNRPRSLSRLLNSLRSANYPNSNIVLIISIDNGPDNQDVVDIANSFEWEFGTKKVIYQPNNLGLRAHILKCGDYSTQYGSVIVLEDDLLVSPNFYHYTINALEFSNSDTKIGGISLYNHQLNVHTFENFNPVEDGFDNWYFQFASSWGQAWSANQWTPFIKWLGKNPNINDKTAIPKYVRSWSEKSWLKYNIAYLIENDLYFIYPKISHTTNFSDQGTHVNIESTLYQVPLFMGDSLEYKFSLLNESKAVYDAFYENQNLSHYLSLSPDMLTVDLYGYKPNSNRQYLLTSKKLNYKRLRTFGRSLKPIDLNIIYKTAGEDLFLYDTSIVESNKFKGNNLTRFYYNVKHVSYKNVLFVSLKMTTDKAYRLIKKIIKPFIFNR